MHDHIISISTKIRVCCTHLDEVGIPFTVHNITGSYFNFPSGIHFTAWRLSPEAQLDFLTLVRKDIATSLHKTYSTRAKFENYRALMEPYGILNNAHTFYLASSPGHSRVFNVTRRKIFLRVTLKFENAGVAWGRGYVLLGPHYYT